MRRVAAIAAAASALMLFVGPAAVAQASELGILRVDTSRYPTVSLTVRAPSGLAGRDIGAITIKEGYSLVEVPEGAVDEVSWALKRTTIKGKKVKVRRDTG